MAFILIEHLEQNNQYAAVTRETGRSTRAYHSWWRSSSNCQSTVRAFLRLGAGRQSPKLWHNRHFSLPTSDPAGNLEAISGTRTAADVLIKLRSSSSIFSPHLATLHRASNTSIYKLGCLAAETALKAVFSPFLQVFPEDWTDVSVKRHTPLPSVPRIAKSLQHCVVHGRDEDDVAGPTNSDKDPIATSLRMQGGLSAATALTWVDNFAQSSGVGWTFN
ncbi:hypothetical protein BV20DRAFT_1115470 [Pilatotrama ljubarskyi]|nr:hypothetical protein BV20DRAFT_1115470 [Pilatotrama ljubarskyi]